MTTISSKEFYKEKLKTLNCCVIIPTYNNEQTLASVISDVLEYASNVIVVNDGATDSTPEILKKFENQIDVISYYPNKGKGIALRTGIKHAIQKGFKYAISIDSDGQHFADDIPVFIDKIELFPDTLLVGARNLHQENMPKKNSFGNKFSNFWFHLFTGIKLPDTQSGYRLYPIEKIKNTKYFTTKYEFEVEIIVKTAWQGIDVMPVPIKVFYAEGDKRISHFRPFKDFTRIGFLYTYLFFLAFLWYKPIMVFQKIKKGNLKLFLKKQFLNTDESILRKSVAVAFGVFMGIIPIWGYQFVSALLFAHFLKLNKAIVGLAANISIPPMIPFLLYGSLKTGQLILGKDMRDNIFNKEINFETIKQHFLEYIIGSCVFALIMAILLGITGYVILKIIEKKKMQSVNF